METRILVEVADFVVQAKKLDGRPLYTDVMLMSGIINVTYSILFERRLDSGGTRIAHIARVLHEILYSYSLIVELTTFPILRFLPRYCRRIDRAVAHCNKFAELIGGGIDEALSSDEESLAKIYVESEPDRTKHVTLL